MDAKAIEEIKRQVLQETLVQYVTYQLTDHANFLVLMLTDPDLKAQALSLYEGWSRYKRMVFLDDTDHDQKTFVELMDKLDRFQHGLLELVQARKPIGFVYESFLIHIIEELHLWRDELNGIQPQNPLDRVKWWNNHAREWSSLTAQLLDPTEKKAIATQKHIAELFESLPDNETSQFLILSLRYQQQLISEAEGALIQPPSSVMFPELVIHDIREQYRGLVEINDSIQQ